MNSTELNCWATTAANYENRKLKLLAKLQHSGQKTGKNYEKIPGDKHQTPTGCYQKQLAAGQTC